MTLDGAQRSNEKLTWFFTDPASRYTLAEVVILTRCSKDDIQNWVRRGMIQPDETTPGRRIYLPATVATLLVAAELRLQGESANHALMHAHVVTNAAFRWFAGKDVPDGTIPKLERDFRQHYAVLAVYEDVLNPPAEPSEPGLLRGTSRIGICHRSEIDAWLDWPAVRVVRVHWLWLLLAEQAKTMKERRGQLKAKVEA